MQKICISAFEVYLFKMFSTFLISLLAYQIGDLEDNAEYRTKLFKKQLIDIDNLFNAANTVNLKIPLLYVDIYTYLFDKT